MMKYKWWARIAALGLSAWIGCAAAAGGDKPLGYLVEPAPAWVVPMREVNAAPVERGPMHYRLVDDQLRVEDRSATSYHRVVRVVDTAEGLAMAAQVEYEFDPSYQTFVWHRLDVVRNGKRVNRLDRKRMQVLRRETNLERQMVDGRATVAIALEDVRVGDEVDIAYSIRGSNPAFEGRFVEWVQVGGGRAPALAHQIRLLAPSQRNIQATKLPQLQVSTRDLGALRETVFRAEALPQIRFDSGTPESAYLAHVLQFSEFADWGEVVRWGRRLFDSRSVSPALDAKAKEIAAASADPQARVLAALDFVQREVRYFGTEGGINSHRPQAPEDVLARRFGDCKDKVGLLLALLRRLDVDAVPVLVSASNLGAVDRMLPGPHAFDHAIARVSVGGATYWLDATRSRQTGALKARSATGFERGLVLREGADALAALPDALDVERMAVTDTLRFEGLGNDAQLESRIVYRGELAEQIRDAITARGKDFVVNDVFSTYRRLYPGTRMVGAAEVIAPENDDSVALLQRFAVPDFWRLVDEKSLVGEIVPWLLAEQLVIPKVESRRDPLAFSYPGIYRHTIGVDLGEEMMAQPPSGQRGEDGDRHFRWSTDITGTRRQFTQAAQLRVGRLVEPAAWPAFSAKVGKVLPRMSTTITLSALPAAAQAELSAQLKDLKAFLKAQPVVPVTDVQGKAAVRAALFTQQLRGGRLSPRLQAQVLVARGIEYDFLGRRQEGKADFQRALELAPGMVEALNGSAVNALGSGELPEALRFVAQVLEQDPHNAEALRVRSLARYLQRDYAGAMNDSSLALRDGPASGSGYRVLLMALAARHAGSPLERVESEYPRERWPAAWPRPLLEHFWGKGSVDDVLKAARATEDPLGSLTEAYYYLGERLAAGGDREAAKSYWKKAVEQRVVEFQEHGLATYQLAH